MRDCYVVSRYSSMSIDPYCVTLDIGEVEDIVKIESYSEDVNTTAYNEFIRFRNGLSDDWTDGEWWSVHRVNLRGEL